MNIIGQNQEKINGILSTFDRMIINGYLLNLCNYRQFLYYLIQNDIKLKDFDTFATSQTTSLCNHIDEYIKSNNYGKYSKLSNLEIILDNLENKPLMPRMKKLLRNIYKNLDVIKSDLNVSKTENLDNIINGIIMEVIN